MKATAFEQTLTTGPNSVVRRKDLPVVQAALEEIERRNGKLTPKLVVEEVRRNPKSVLAQYFDNPTEAAMNWWIEQARSVIQSVYVYVEEQKIEPTRKWSSVTVTTPQKKGPQYVYMDTFAALSDDRFREQQLHTALAEIETWQRKYATLRKYCKLIDRLSTGIYRALKHRKK